MTGQTPSQTVGPYFGIGLPWKGGENLLTPDVKGERIQITGRLIDGESIVVPDGLIEIWQADTFGHYAHPDDDRKDVGRDPAFIGFGRCPTDFEGRFHFHTIRPGRVPGPGNALQAPHILVGIFARGTLRRHITRLYFEDAPENAEDPVLGLVEESRRPTLIAKRLPGPAPLYSFNIILQGKGETVFFEC